MKHDQTRKLQGFKWGLQIRNFQAYVPPVFWYTETGCELTGLPGPRSSRSVTSVTTSTSRYVLASLSSLSRRQGSSQPTIGPLRNYGRPALNIIHSLGNYTSIQHSLLWLVCQFQNHNVVIRDKFLICLEFVIALQIDDSGTEPEIVALPATRLQVSLLWANPLRDQAHSHRQARTGI